jgi:hypothetical protein
MDGLFDDTTWKQRLNDLVDEIVSIGDPEIAIKCIRYYDDARKKIDRIQAFPHYGARSEIFNWERIDNSNVFREKGNDCFKFVVYHPSEHRLILEVSAEAFRDPVRAETYTNGRVTTLRLVDADNRILGSSHLFNGGD